MRAAEEQQRSQDSDRIREERKIEALERIAAALELVSKDPAEDQDDQGEERKIKVRLEVTGYSEITEELNKLSDEIEKLERAASLPAWWKQVIRWKRAWDRKLEAAGRRHGRATRRKMTKPPHRITDLGDTRWPMPPAPKRRHR